jgi:hypothetical protein
MSRPRLVDVLREIPSRSGALVLTRGALEPDEDRLGIGDAAQAAIATAAAYEKGVAEGRAEAALDIEQRLAEVEGRTAETIARERALWVEETAQALEAQLAQGLSDIEARIAETSRRVLLPFMRAALRDVASDQLLAAVEDALATSRHTTVIVHGPDDLAAAFGERLAGRGIAYQCVAGRQVDIEVQVDGVTMAANLTNLLARLDEIAS